MAKRSRSPVSDVSRSGSGSDSVSDVNGGSGSDSGASVESIGDRRHKNKVARREVRHSHRDKRNDVRSSKKMQKSKSYTNSNRKQREKSLSPHYRSESRSRDRRKEKYIRRVDNKESRGRNGDYRVSDKREHREVR